MELKEVDEYVEENSYVLTDNDITDSKSKHRNQQINHFRKNEAKSVEDMSVIPIEVDYRDEQIVDVISEFKDTVIPNKPIDIPEDSNMNQVQQELIEQEINKENLKEWIDKYYKKPDRYI